MSHRFAVDVPRLVDIASFGGLDAEKIRDRHFRSLGTHAAESWTRRRVFAGILASTQLDSRHAYYHLTKRATEWLKREHGIKVSRAAARPFRPMAKILRLAAAEYCTPQDRLPLSLIRPFQNSERFPELAAYVATGNADPLRQKLLYADGDLLGFLVVDRGQDQFVLRKVQPKVLSLSRWASLRSLMDRGEFRLTVLTPSSNRQAELIESIEASPPPFAWEVVVIPKLLEWEPRPVR